MPLFFIYCAAAVFGVIFGSFLNVVVLRDDRRASIMTGRSECVHCKHELRWFELIPLVSFAMQGGRCRSCEKKLSWQYPIGEATVALLAVFSVWLGYSSFGTFSSQSALFSAGLFIGFAALFVMSATDLRTMEIRPEYAIGAGIAGALGNILSGYLTWQEAGLGLLVGAGSILILSYGWKLLTGKQGMGDGDVWIAGAVGLLVGYPLIIPALFAAVTVGAVVGVVLATRIKKGLGIEMPFGPYLALGALIALIWGHAILQWYIL